MKTTNSEQNPDQTQQTELQNSNNVEKGKPVGSTAGVNEVDKKGEPVGSTAGYIDKNNTSKS